MRSLALTILILAPSLTLADDLAPLKYNNPGLVVDLGVGLWAWPLPMDYDGDGDMDLVVNCPDKPHNGTYFFENPGQPASGARGPKLPIFKPAVRIGPGQQNVEVSYVNGEPRVLTPGREWINFRKAPFEKSTAIYSGARVEKLGKIRANMWKYADYDGDGAIDLIVGVGEWTEYGWDDAYDKNGQWTNGPLHGWVYLLRNHGSTGKPAYDESRRIEAGGKPIDVYGWPSPNLADFDGDGDLDIICGEFLDAFTWFENVGTRTEPKYAAGRRLTVGGQLLHMDLQMITPTAVDWDGDGDVDLVCGDEDGRVALIEHTGKVVDHMPQFAEPRYFQQEADTLKFGALATPVGVDLDGDGDDDIVSGNTAGYIAFIENLSGPKVAPPSTKWAAPRLLEADGKVIRIQAGPNGSIQGPAEAKWGYTTLTVADWDGDKLPDLIVNSIWGKVVWYRNMGTRASPRFAASRPIEVAWGEGKRSPKPSWFWWDPTGDELVTQWRTTPVAIDYNRDGLTDLLMLDHEGYLAFFERVKRGGSLALLPPKRMFVDEKGEPLRLNDRRAGGSGRRKLCIVDFDGDGRLDVLINSTNADLLRNEGERDGKVILKNVGALDKRQLAGHTSSPTVINLDGDDVPDLLVGGEDGHLYFKKRAR